MPLAPTRFHLLRHALVEPEARTHLYGRMDVDICADSLTRHQPVYAALAKRLPQSAILLVTPLRRTHRTLEMLFAAGYPRQPILTEPDLTEQDLGAWQGLPHDALPAQLAGPAHPFWPLGAGETPPGGESMEQVVRRVGHAIERLATRHPGQDIVAISHGGAIRAAVAHAMGIPAHAALHLAVQNLGLTSLERDPSGWRVRGVNEAADFAG